MLNMKLKAITTAKEFENGQCEVIMKEENVLIFRTKTESRLKNVINQHLWNNICHSQNQTVSEEDKYWLIAMYGNNQQFVDYMLHLCADIENIKNHMEAALNLFSYTDKNVK